MSPLGVVTEELEKEAKAAEDKLNSSKHLLKTVEAQAEIVSPGIKKRKAWVAPEKPKLGRVHLPFTITAEWMDQLVHIDEDTDNKPPLFMYL